MANLFTRRRALLHLLTEARAERDAWRKEYAKIKKHLNKVNEKTCNNCAAVACRFAPRWGDLVRFNCPFWQKREG